MSSLNLKQQVKEGKITPQEALKRLIANSVDHESAGRSRTARWLSSPNAQKRYEQARKQKS